MRTLRVFLTYFFLVPALLACSSAESEGTVREADTRASAPAAQDTLEARLEAAFPGFRLATEAEIGERFQRWSEFSPAEFLHPSAFGDTQERWFGTGERWWVWRGDFDQDGAQDVATIVTNVEDPTQDLFVVLHGNGTFTHLGEVGPKVVGSLRMTQEDGSVVDRLVWNMVEKDAGWYEWNADLGEYEPRSPERECC